MKKVMKKQPTPPGKKYTAKDSAQFVQTEGRLKKNVEKFKKEKYLDIDNTNLIKRQIDSLGKNPYMKTALEREKAKASSNGGMKSTKVASKAKSTPPDKKIAKTKAKIEKLSARNPKSTIGRVVNTYRTMSARTKLEKQESKKK